jgi:hypothetical protein
LQLINDPETHVLRCTSSLINNASFRYFVLLSKFLITRFDLQTLSSTPTTSRSPQNCGNIVSNIVYVRLEIAAIPDLSIMYALFNINPISVVDEQFREEGKQH